MNQSVVFVGDGIYAAGDYIKNNILCPYEFAPAHLSLYRGLQVSAYMQSICMIKMERLIVRKLLQIILDHLKQNDYLEKKNVKSKY